MPIGPTARLEHWLEPSVGEATARVAAGGAHVAASTEEILIGVAVAIALAGIAIAWARLKPSELVPKAAAAPSTGFARVLENKWFVDEAYDAAIVKPTYTVSRSVLWAGVDVGLIDTLLVNGSAALARFLGWVGGQVQSGRVGTYAWLLVIGAILVLRAFARVP
jgi:NADH-quinone oxidoreductase subunit L